MQKLEYIANKDLPLGTKYEVVLESNIPEDRLYSGAWKYVAGPLEKVAVINKPIERK